MHPRTEEVLNYLDARRDDLRAAVDLVPVDLRERQPDSDRWSVAQVLDHLTLIDRRVGMGLKKWLSDAKTKGIGPENETSSVLNSVPRDLIIDRSRRVQSPTEIRPGDDIDARTAWSALARARAE